jgi:hypothetical protein
MTPEDNFSGRSTNQFGVCEILNFGLTITPGDMSGSEIAMIDWVFTTSPTNATVSINNSGHGSVTLFGPSIPATVNVALTVSDNFRALTNSWTYPFIIPSSLVCVPTTVTIFDSAGVSHGPSVWHEVNSGSVGKKLLFYLFPSAVSFREIHIREGVSTNEFATGIFTNQAPHNVGGWRTVGSGDSTTGSLVNTVDTSDTGLIGANQPRSVFQPNGGTFGYDIWIEYKRTTESDNMARKAFTVPYRVTVSGNGRTELKKDGMTPIAREWDDPYSNY